VNHVVKLTVGFCDPDGLDPLNLDSLVFEQNHGSLVCVEHSEDRRGLSLSSHDDKIPSGFSRCSAS